MTSPTQTILDAIPHRPPFLFIDEVIQRTDGAITTRKYVDPASDFFRGHYPHHPIMPGVLLCEAVFQSGAMLMASRQGAQTAGMMPVITRIADARFKQMVTPGQTLTIEVTLDDTLDEAAYMTGKATVEGKLAVRVSFVVMLVPAVNA